VATVCGVSRTSSGTAVVDLCPEEPLGFATTYMLLQAHFLHNKIGKYIIILIIFINFSLYHLPLCIIGARFEVFGLMEC